MLGARYIELFPLAHAGGAPTHADAQQQQQQHVRGMRQPALAAPAMRPPLVAGAAPASASLRMRGLPWGASADDVAAFFLSYGLVREAITFGPMGGQATVWFASPHEAARALAEKNHQHMGQRYIELGYAPPQ
jgi:RNA recognition motif-containing protein